MALTRQTQTSASAISRRVTPEARWPCFWRGACPVALPFLPVGAGSLLSEPPLSSPIAIRIAISAIEINPASAPLEMRPPPLPPPGGRGAGTASWRAGRSAEVCSNSRR